MAVQPIPADYPRLNPYLYVDGAAEAIDFYIGVLGATQRGERMPAPDGKVGHCELQFGDSVVMLADEFPDMGAIGPRTVGGSPVSLHLYVEDVDATFAAAVAAGATAIQPLENKFYGDRAGEIEDPWGHRWYLASHVEDVSPEEMGKRVAAMMAEG